MLELCVRRSVLVATLAILTAALPVFAAACVDDASTAVGSRPPADAGAVENDATLEDARVEDAAQPDAAASNDSAARSLLSCPAAAMAFTDVDVGEVRLHVGCEGDGPVVVLLHGYPEFYAAWSRVAAALVAQGYRVVVPDQRGYDLSDKPADAGAYQIDHLVGDLSGLVAATGGTRVLLVGHDWGGTVGWIFAHRSPALLRGLVVLAGPHPDIWGHADVDPVQAQASSRYVPLVAGPLGEAAFNGFDGLLAPFMDAGELGTYHAAWNQPDAKVAMNDWYRANLYPDVTMPTGVDVDVPALVMWGTGDTFTTPSELALLPDYVHHLQVVTWPDAGHFIELDPALTADIATRIVAFERGLGP